MGMGDCMKIFVILFSVCIASVFAAEDSAWVQLFRPDDVNLSDWTPKFQNQAAGVNQNNVFRYAAKGSDSASPGAGPRLEVVMTHPWNDGSSTFGHLFYKTPFSYYLLRAQFHFTDTVSHFMPTQAHWTIQNNGLMLHSEDPNKMDVNLNFPNSFEDQLLGYWSYAIADPPYSTSSNICLQPNTTIRYGNEVLNNDSHGNCTMAKFHSLEYVKNFSPTVWQYALAKVLADSSMTFYVKSKADTAWDSVMHFTEIKKFGSPFKQGYIAIQAEGTSTEFAKIELLNLVGCMDKTSPSFRTYFVKNDASKCSAVGIKNVNTNASQISMMGRSVISDAGILNVEVFDTKGTRVLSLNGKGKKQMELHNLTAGLYTIRVKTEKGLSQILHSQF